MSLALYSPSRSRSLPAASPLRPARWAYALARLLGAGQASAQEAASADATAPAVATEATAKPLEHRAGHRLAPVNGARGYATTRAFYDVIGRQYTFGMRFNF